MQLEDEAAYQELRPLMFSRPCHRWSAVLLLLEVSWWMPG
jgi:hypothetical protein